MSNLNTNVTRSIAQTAQYIQELWSREVQAPFSAKLPASQLV